MRDIGDLLGWCICLITSMGYGTIRWSILRLYREQMGLTGFGWVRTGLDGSGCIYIGLDGFSDVIYL